MNIKEIAYEKYKLDWMLAHNCTIKDLIMEIQIYKDEIDSDLSLDSMFADWEFGYGFKGEIWASYNEFLETEFLDKSYMIYLLTNNEYLEYLDVINGGVTNENK